MTPIKSQPPYREMSVNAFEHMMYADDHVKTPMTVFLRLVLQGEIKKEVMIQAIEMAVQRHPILQSHISGVPNQRGKDLKWVHLKEPQKPYIDWAEEQRKPKFPCDKNKSIDLKNEIGARFFVTRLSGEVSILAQFHHACLDGRGASLVLEDILIYYHCLRSGLNPQDYLSPLDTGLLENRNTLHKDKNLVSNSRSDRAARIKKFFAHRPEVLGSRKRPANEPVQYPALRTFTLDKDAIAALKRFAKSREITMNDALLVQMFRALNDWNRQHLKGKRGKKSVRIAMPICMRRPEEQNSTAVNIVSMCFIDRLPHQIESDDVYNSIAIETGLIKKNFEGVSLLRVIDIFAKLRYGFKILQTPTPLMRCHTTAVLSNMGMPFKRPTLERISKDLDFGEFKVSQLEAVPPFRVNSPIALAVVTVNDTMTVSMNFDNSVLSFVDAEEIMQDFQRKIRMESKAAAIDPSELKIGARAIHSYDKPESKSGATRARV